MVIDRWVGTGGKGLTGEWQLLRWGEDVVSPSSILLWRSFDVLLIVQEYRLGIVELPSDLLLFGLGDGGVFGKAD